MKKLYAVERGWGRNILEKMRLFGYGGCICLKKKLIVLVRIGSENIGDRKKVIQTRHSCNFGKLCEVGGAFHEVHIYR